MAANCSQIANGMYDLRILRALILAGVLFLVPGTVAAFGQNADDATIPTSENDSALKAGDKALAAGEHGKAIAAYTRAMSSETLSQADFARALYRRGAAYQASGKPAQAIADLTKALWLKKLTAQDRNEAVRYRALAYEAVGLTKQAAADKSKLVDGKAIANGAAAGTETAVSEKQSKSGSWKTAVNDQPAKKSQSGNSEGASKQGAGLISGFFRNLRARTKTEPEITTGAISKPVRPNAKTSEAEPKPNVNPAETSSEERAETSAALAGWEANVAEPRRRGLFGFAARLGRSSLHSAASTSNADGAADNAPRKEAELPAGGRKTRPDKVAALQSGGDVSPAESLLFTGYRIQLAAISSEAGAKEAWRQLVAKHSNLLVGWDPEFRDIGNGKSFGVQIGPFADKDEPEALCKTFKNNGLDCIVVSR